MASSVDHTYQDPNNRRRDRGNCEIDQRHTFNLTAVAETPKFANRTLSLLGSGWRLSGIYRDPRPGLSSRPARRSGVRTVTLGAPAAPATAPVPAGIGASAISAANARIWF